MKVLFHGNEHTFKYFESIVLCGNVLNFTQRLEFEDFFNLTLPVFETNKDWRSNVYFAEVAPEPENKS